MLLKIIFNKKINKKHFPDTRFNKPKNYNHVSDQYNQINNLELFCYMISCILLLLRPLTREDNVLLVGILAVMSHIETSIGLNW